MLIRTCVILITNTHICTYTQIYLWSVCVCVCCVGYCVLCGVCQQPHPRVCHIFSLSVCLSVPRVRVSICPSPFNLLPFLPHPLISLIFPLLIPSPPPFHHVASLSTPLSTFLSAPSLIPSSVRSAWMEGRKKYCCCHPLGCFHFIDFRNEATTNILL